MRIAFLGLGAMGGAMARRLLEHGHTVVVWNRSPEPARAIVSLGALSASTPSAAVQNVEIAITMLADDSAAEAVTLGPTGIVEGLAPAAAHVSMSTISVALSGRFAEAHAGRGQGYAAAPVFGRPDAAEAGKLFIAAAGEAGLIEKIRPALEAMSQRIFIMGESAPEANLVKLAGNFLITCVIESLAEVFAVTSKGGVETAKMHELLTETLFAAPVYKVYGGMILENKFSPPGFKMPLGLKDNRLLQQAAEHLAVPMPFAAVVRDRFLAAIANGDGGLDWSAIARRAAGDAGLGTGS